MIPNFGSCIQHWYSVVLYLCIIVFMGGNQLVGNSILIVENDYVLVSTTIVNWLSAGEIWITGYSLLCSLFREVVLNIWFLVRFFFASSLDVSLIGSFNRRFCCSCLKCTFQIWKRERGRCLEIMFLVKPVHVIKLIFYCLNKYWFS